MTMLVVKMSISLDGYVAGADGSTNWISPTYDDAATAWTVATLRGASAHLMGSATYRAMASYWPHESTDFAAPMNDTPKVVFSRSMTTSEWGNTRFVAGELVGELTTLKAESADGYLLAHGGAHFVRSLCRTGLIDEIRLLVHPVVLGDGERMFPDPMDLKPIAATAFIGGAVAHVLSPAE